MVCCCFYKLTYYGMVYCFFPKLKNCSMVYCCFPKLKYCSMVCCCFHKLTYCSMVCCSVQVPEIDVFRPDSMWDAARLAMGVSNLAALLVDQVNTY
jgi:hypothetical protein